VKEIEPIRVIVADSHTRMRRTICCLITLEADIRVVAEAETTQEVFRKVQELSPQVLVIDMELCAADGIGVIRRLKEEDELVRILALSLNDEQEYVREVLRSGVDGYLLKDDAPDLASEAVRCLARGKNGSFFRVSSDWAILPWRKRWAKRPL